MYIGIFVVRPRSNIHSFERYTIFENIQNEAVNVCGCIGLFVDID